MRIVGISFFVPFLMFILGMPLLAQSAQKICDVYAAHPSDNTNFARYNSFSELKKFADDAVRACEEAAKGGDPRYIFQLGRAYLAQGNEALAVYHYTEAEIHGHILARFFLADWKRVGKYGILKDSAKALKMHKDIASNHQGAKIAASSAFWTGWMHHSRLEGVEKSIQLAKHFYELSMKLGDHRGNYGLGFIHLRSKGYLDDTKALAYFEQSIKKSAFKRLSARKYAAEILFKKFDKSFDSQKIAAEKGNVTRALEHLSARRGKNKANHRDYLTKVADTHIKILAVVLLEENVWTERGSAESRRKLRKWHKDLGQALSKGLIGRLEIFPNDFLGKGETMSKLVHLNSAITKMETAAKDIKAERNFLFRATKNEDAKISQECISRDGDWENFDYKVRVRNKCPIGIRVRLALDVTMKSGGRKNEVFNFSLPAKGSKTKRIHGGKQASSGGSTMAACPDHFGTMKLNFESKENTYTCQRTEGLTLTNPHVSKWEKEIARTLLELIGTK